MAGKRSGKRSTFVDFLDALTDTGVKLGALAFVGSLGYLVYGLVAGSGLPKIMSLPPEDRARVLGNVAFACRVLGVSGTVLALSAAARYYAEETLGYMMSLLGVMLYFGTPWAFSSWFEQPNPAIALVVVELRLLGMILFLPGVVLLVRDITFRVRFGAAHKEKEKRDGAFLVGDEALREEEPYRPRAYAKCWQMPYCREFVRKICPAYEARKSCWRVKAGCYCDEQTILRAMKIQSKEGRMFAKDLRYRMGSTERRTKLSRAQKRALCRSCVIYQLHQQQKYKLISPLVFPATAALIWVMYPTIEAVFRKGVHLTDVFMKKVSFLPQAYDKVPSGSSVPQVVLVFFVAWLAIVAVSYGLRLVEFCIFKAQI